MRVIIWLIAAGSLAALLASFAGAWHPAGDSLAVFRPVWALALLFSGLFLRGPVRLFCGAVALAVMLPILWSALQPAQGPGKGIALYQKNLRFDLADPAPIIADIQASGAGIVFLQEVSRRNLAVPEGLKHSYPYQLICPAHSVGAVAIISRWPLDGADCTPGSGMALAQVATPIGVVSAAVLHLNWPWPYGQAQQVSDLSDKIRYIPQPAVIAGDFNMVPWSHAVRWIAGATGTRRAGPLRASFALEGLYPMVIDHVLVPDGWAGQSSMRPRLGSDHRGIFVATGPESMMADAPE